MHCFKWWLLPPSGSLSEGVMMQAEPVSCPRRLCSVTKKSTFGDFLVVQRLRLGLFTVKGPGSIPGQGTKILQVLLLLLSHFSRVWLCVTPQRAVHQAPRPWDSPGKNTGVGCHFLLQCMNVKSESEVAESCLTRVRPHGLQPPRLLCPWDFPGKSRCGQKPHKTRKQQTPKTRNPLLLVWATEILCVFVFN